jgi:hypothetical protein
MYALIYRRKNVGYSLSVSVEGVVMLLLFLAPFRRNLIPQMSVSESQAVNIIKNTFLHIIMYISFHLLSVCYAYICRETITSVVVCRKGLHCNGHSVYIFLFWELRGLSPNFHVHVSVIDLYNPRIGPHNSFSRKGRPIVEIYNSLTDT